MRSAAATLALLAAALAAPPAEATFPYPAPPAGTPPQDYAAYCFLPTTSPPVRPSDFTGGTAWKLTSDQSGDPTIDASPAELFGVTGMSVDLAWQITTGRPDVTIAVLDSGIKWNDFGAMMDLADKVRLNRGELPPPEDAVGHTKPELPGPFQNPDPYDLNDDGCSTPVEAAAALHLGGDCADARTPDAIAGCLVGTHDADADAVLAVAGAAPAALPEAERACQLEATGRTREVLLGRVHLLAPCQRHPPRALAPGSGCAEYPPLAARLARLGSRAAARIAARCGGAALGGAHFGVPCDAPADGGVLARCLLGVAGAAADDALAAERPDPGFCGDTRATVERRVGRLLARMTLAEKLDQMHGVGRTPGLAGRITGLARLRIPGIGMLDGARGVSAISGHATCFPVGMARGATWDEALEERVGEAIGAETRAKGGSMILAPVVNILRHLRWGRAQETYGEDTVHLGRMGVAFVRGAQRHVIANPKHYALNSIEDTRFAVDVAVDERSLREVFLPHFRRAVQEGHAGAVMAAYNQVNGAHCSENTHLLRDVLDGDWGFQGFVGYFHGYRYLDRNDTAPLFPFGFGLAYTTFRYSNLAITPATVSAWGRVRVTADVTNTGPIAGDEVAQLYVGYRGSRVDRAVRDLKAFARVHLEAGETRTVPFEVRAPDLAFWDAGAGALVVEPIAYTVEVGPSSRDLPLAGAFAVSPRR